MALTCQLNPDESAEPRIYSSSQIHHPRNSQLWVIWRFMLWETCGCGRESRLAGICDSLHCSSASSFERGILSVMQISSDQSQWRYDERKTSHNISISCIFLLSSTWNHMPLFFLFIGKMQISAALWNLWKVHADIGTELLSSTHFQVFHIY